MKNITLLFGLLLTITTLNAQENNISFEASEGYTLGEVNGQNGWFADPQYSELFKVSDENASAGDYALKGSIDSGNIIPGNGSVVAALGPVYNNLSTDSLRMSCDLFLSGSPTSREMDDFEIFVFGQQTEEGTLLTARVVFSQGQIAVETTDPNNPDGFVYQPAGSFDYGTFFNFRMDFDFTGDVITYYLDDELIFTGDVFSGTELNRYGFFTNGVDQFFVDNINLENDPDLDVKKFTTSTFTHFVDSENMLQLSSAKSAMQQVKIFNLLGQNVIDQNLNSTSATIDLNTLDSGIYLVQLEIGGKTQAFKIVRK